LLTAARESDPENARITLTLAEAQAIAGDIDAADETLGALPPGEQEKPEVAALRSHLYFAAQVAEAPDEADLEARLRADVDDNEARLKLAMRKVVGQDYDTAIELLLELMQKDRSFGDDAGRNTLVRVFDLMGDDPRVGQYRRRMASLLY
jgi:putative thioredoxin